MASMRLHLWPGVQLLLRGVQGRWLLLSRVDERPRYCVQCWARFRFLSAWLWGRTLRSQLVLHGPRSGLGSALALVGDWRRWGRHAGLAPWGHGRRSQGGAVGTRIEPAFLGDRVRSGAEDACGEVVGSQGSPTCGNPSVVECGVGQSWRARRQLRRWLAPCCRTLGAIAHPLMLMATTAQCSSMAWGGGQHAHECLNIRRSGESWAAGAGARVDG